MIQQRDAKYVILFLVVSTGLGVWTTIYEIFFVDTDSVSETFAAIQQGVGTAVAIAVYVQAWLEVMMVLARQINESRDRNIREANNRAWREWLERRDKALAEGQPFDEPAPDGKEADKAKA